jgi:signal transduction histidine kinase
MTNGSSIAESQAVSEQHHSPAAAAVATAAQTPTVTQELKKARPVLVISDVSEYAAALAHADCGASLLTSREVLNAAPASADACIMVGVSPEAAESCIAALHPRCFIYLVFADGADRVSNARVLHVPNPRPDVCIVLAFVHLLTELHSAHQHAKAAEYNAQREQQHAALGRYMLQVRHEVNNVLTSIIGNTELLQMRDAESDPAECSDQLDTVHAMSLRLHEILQRFSSLDAEMRLSARPSQNENGNIAPRYLPHGIHDAPARKPVDL